MKKEGAVLLEKPVPDRTTKREKEKKKKGKNSVSPAHNGSQGGNGLLHLIHIPSGEQEHGRRSGTIF